MRELNILIPLNSRGNLLIIYNQKFGKEIILNDNTAELVFDEENVLSLSRLPFKGGHIQRMWYSKDFIAVKEIQVYNRILEQEYSEPVGCFLYERGVTYNEEGESIVFDVFTLSHIDSLQYWTDRRSEFIQEVLNQGRVSKE